MFKSSGQQFAQEEHLIGQTRFRNYANIRVVRPEFAKRRMNGFAVETVLDGSSQPGKRFGPRLDGNVEKRAKQSVNPSSPLS